MDKRTINLFEELAEDGASLNNIGSKDAYKKIVQCSGEIPEEENYDKSDLLKADQNVKNLALKIINEQERNFSKLIIETAKARMQSGNLPVGLLCLAWKIMSDNVQNAQAQLGSKSAIHELTMPSRTPQEILPFFSANSE